MGKRRWPIGRPRAGIQKLRLSPAKFCCEPGRPSRFRQINCQSADEARAFWCCSKMLRTRTDSGSTCTFGFVFEPDQESIWQFHGEGSHHAETRNTDLI